MKETLTSRVERLERVNLLLLLLLSQADACFTARGAQAVLLREHREVIEEPTNALNRLSELLLPEEVEA